MVDLPNKFKSLAWKKIDWPECNTVGLNEHTVHFHFLVVLTLLLSSRMGKQKDATRRVVKGFDDIRCPIGTILEPFILLTAFLPAADKIGTNKQSVD